jgi:hypothetical protein
MLPAVGDKGTFKFSEPFNKLIRPEQILTVTAIRTIKNIYDNGENPLATIYQLVGLTESDFNYDLANNVLIVEFKTGNNYFSVPSNRILSLPNSNGVLYCQKVIAVPLGDIPSDHNLTPLINDIKDLVLEITGIITKPVASQISAEYMVSKEKHTEFLQVLNSRINRLESYKSKYENLSVELSNKNKTIADLQKAIIHMSSNIE